MKFLKSVVFGLSIFALFSFHGEHIFNNPIEAFNADSFPIPPHSEKMLFYVQRTPNTNTLVYELNILPDGTLNVQEPVHIFWIRYKDKGEKEELSYLQRKYAYGLHSKIDNREKHSYKLNFVSYSKRHLYLQKSYNDKKYHIYTNIAGKWAILQRIFINIEGGTLWVPNIKKIEMHGKDQVTGKSVSEFFQP